MTGKKTGSGKARTTGKGVKKAAGLPEKKSRDKIKPGPEPVSEIADIDAALRIGGYPKELPELFLDSLANDSKFLEKRERLRIASHFDEYFEKNGRWPESGPDGEIIRTKKTGYNPELSVVTRFGPIPLMVGVTDGWGRSVQTYSPSGSTSIWRGRDDRSHMEVDREGDRSSSFYFPVVGRLPPVVDGYPGRLKTKDDDVLMTFIKTATHTIYESGLSYDPTALSHLTPLINEYIGPTLEWFSRENTIYERNPRSAVSYFPTYISYNLIHTELLQLIFHGGMSGEDKILIKIYFKPDYVKKYHRYESEGTIIGFPRVDEWEVKDIKEVTDEDGKYSPGKYYVINVAPKDMKESEKVW